MTSKILKHKNALRARRKKGIRLNLSGCGTVPRVSIFKSNRTIYAQAINDKQAVTLASSDGKKLGLRSNKDGAVALAQNFSKELSSKNITQIVFDRNGYKYHGVVKAFADTLREHGIKF
ncbi:MAG: LSU ribosomal protein L18p (L5e) [uncultured Campylobacterales bacterium]|uniref:Large ribosomal subunit protein uL18 n=1 Tax=uncultured Campylobacterales bacterium TaxID=352960 RepID=A0A6S6S2M3_9BACT|nr:MAG: LSU ribosomal protein L18p (L5e) [uncultured Campylobacterales bacterium]